jgi:hypothetical protein
LKGDSSPSPRCALQIKLATNLPHSLAHVSQAIRESIVGRLVEAAPVVFDRDIRRVFGDPDTQRYFAGVGVADDIV